MAFGIFQGSDSPIEIRDRLFEHRTVRGCAGALQVGQRARSGQRERRAFSPPWPFVGCNCRYLGAALSGRFLLRFDRFAFPSSSHTSQYIGNQLRFIHCL